MSKRPSPDGTDVEEGAKDADLPSCLYGGLAQQEPVDPRGIMCRLRQAAKKDDGICYPGQYDNDYVSAPWPCLNRRGAPDSSPSELEGTRALDGTADMEAAAGDQRLCDDHRNRR